MLYEVRGVYMGIMQGSMVSQNHYGPLLASFRILDIGTNALRISPMWRKFVRLTIYLVVVGNGGLEKERVCREHWSPIGVRLSIPVAVPQYMHIYTIPVVPGLDVLLTINPKP